MKEFFLKLLSSACLLWPLVTQPQPQHVFLWGSSGTGKTLLLVEILRMYLAHFNLKHVKTKILVIVYHWCVHKDSKLLEDFNQKYLSTLNSNFDIKIMTMEEACKGKVEYLSTFDICL